jgi:hypothetical protein
MSKVKFQNYSGIKNAKDNPRAIATSDLKNGQAVIYSIGTDGKEYATLPTDVTTAKTAKHFVWNTIDKPELDNESDFVIKSGEFARIFEYPQAELMDISADLVVTTTVSTGDILVPTASGKYVTATASDTGYGFGLKVKEKTTFSGSGYTALVVTR